MYFYYLVAKDSPGSRALIPWALLIGAIANILLAFWIIYYISVMYPRDKVMIQKYDHDGDDFDEDTGKKKVKYVK